MTKEFLSKRGISFEPMDTENDPKAREALAALGYRAVPVVQVGDKSMAGWNPTRLAALLGVVNFQEKASPAAEMIRSLEIILDGALRAVRQVPDDRLMMRSPDRDRPLRQLAHHVFNIVETAVDADVLGRFEPGMLMLGDVSAQTSAERIARYGEAVLAKFTSWYREVDQAAFDRDIETNDGPRRLGLVFERTRSHSAQHLRQIYEFLRWCEIEPDRPLTKDDLKGVDLPDSVW
ncbi:MAG: glutaredoxin domain-containing protein [Dehalococcoidia bacterium]